MVDMHTFSLLSLAEEISEMNLEGQAVIKAIGKVVRFGKGFEHPHTGIPGIVSLRGEMVDVIAGILETRVFEGFTPEEFEEALKARQAKIRAMRAISKERGMLVLGVQEELEHDEVVRSVDIGALAKALKTKSRN